MSTEHNNGPVWQSQGPTAFTRFLWWLATAEKELLTGCLVEGNRYSIIGMAVLATWVFATLAWTYFFATVTGSASWAIGPGLLMGGIVLCIDRALIKSIDRRNKNKLLPLAFRGLIALTIGFFMAQPAILYIFNKEIQVQVSLDNEKLRQQKRGELDKLHAIHKQELLGRQQHIVAGEGGLAEAVDRARAAYLAEADGSGGTGKVGLKDIAMAKKAEYEKLEARYRALQRINGPLADSIAQQLAQIERQKQTAELQFAQLPHDGFLARIAALQQLLRNNWPLQMRYYLIVLILVLIELLPVLAKSMLPNGNYEQKALLQEAMELALARNNAERQQQLKELYNQLAHDNDKKAIHAFFEAGQAGREAQIKARAAQWAQGGETPFAQLWQQVKEDSLSQQEP
jgi:hypothetical protein